MGNYSQIVFPASFEESCKNAKWCNTVCFYLLKYLMISCFVHGTVRKTYFFGPQVIYSVVVDPGL